MQRHTKAKVVTKRECPLSFGIEYLRCLTKWSYSELVEKPTSLEKPLKFRNVCSM